MGSEIQKATGAEVGQCDAGQTVFVNNGHVGTQIGAVEVLNIHNYGTQPQPLLRADTRIDPDYYNLIVVDGDDPFLGSYSIPKTQIFSTGMDKDMLKEFTHPTPEKLASFKHFPTIIATANRDSNHTDEDHLAAIGLITDIENQKNLLKIKFVKTDTIGQERLNELVKELGIWYASMRNELDVPHWAIKKVPLVATLTAAGYRLPGISAIHPPTNGGDQP